MKLPPSHETVEHLRARGALEVALLAAILAKDRQRTQLLADLYRRCIFENESPEVPDPIPASFASRCTRALFSQLARGK